MPNAERRTPKFKHEDLRGLSVRYMIFSELFLLFRRRAWNACDSTFHMTYRWPKFAVRRLANYLCRPLKENREKIQASHADELKLNNKPSGEEPESWATFSWNPGVETTILAPEHLDKPLNQSTLYLYELCLRAG